jgi:hypothetical protein
MAFAGHEVIVLIHTHSDSDRHHILPSIGLPNGTGQFPETMLLLMTRQIEHRREQVTRHDNGSKLRGGRGVKMSKQ